MFSFVEEAAPLLMVGDDVSILIGEVVDEADTAANKELLDLWIEDTDWSEVLPENDFAINVK
jgi:hypothetical protein